MTYIPVVSILLYAHAAAGPEYEYPACLTPVVNVGEQYKEIWATHGAMIALHPRIGGVNSSEASTAAKFLVNSESNLSPKPQDILNDVASHILRSRCLTVSGVPRIRMGSAPGTTR